MGIQVQQRSDDRHSLVIFMELSREQKFRFGVSSGWKAKDTLGNCHTVTLCCT